MASNEQFRVQPEDPVSSSGEQDPNCWLSDHSVPRLEPQNLQTYTPDLTESQKAVREAIGKICQKYPDDYWLAREQSKEFPADFYQDLAKGGWLGICRPDKYGGLGLGLAEASIKAECRRHLLSTSTFLVSSRLPNFGTEQQKKKFLEPLMAGRERACFAVTEPDTGLDTLKIQAKAVRNGNHYALSGQKIWITTAQTAQKILILARTTPISRVKKSSEGLSLFYTDLNDNLPIQIAEIEKMGHGAIDSNAVFFDGWKVPARDRIGDEGYDFKLIMHGMNAERILIGCEALGLGYAALRRAAIYSNERVVFGRPIGQNQAIQHPLADSWMNLEAARLMLAQAARMYDDGYESGEYANAGKYLAAEAAFKACERAVMGHGGMGYAKEYHVERYLREVLIPRIAPVTKETICNYIGQTVLGLPKSY
ncbi:acyl-CoA dehydrogenase [Metarhizium acridum CQMa 102]|uniref:Acyl-CoA dehydrogenase n=1 Tax=Metarhizium acridum (strain CQMa 102) TaxID=655827 RepID=E9EH13_METAQ|nr:acyl-CoA dehydrogenase [Metarhizium acridum CQMa 102]EFY84798.1 acyl-CoA dehydrogenase [Metarhizium acridum CQMa 102]